MLKLDLTNVSAFIPADHLKKRKEGLEQAASMIWSHTGPGGDFTGWVDLPKKYDKENSLFRCKKVKLVDIW